MWDLRGGFSISVNALLRHIKAEKDIEGVTFLGGEPFLQVRALSALAKKTQTAGLSVVTFTGYNYENLLKRGRHNKRLIKHTDILIDGEFIKSQKDFSRPWTGSSNQRYFFLSERYAGKKEEILSAKNCLEIKIGEDGEIQITGMGDAEELLKSLEKFNR